MPGSQVPNKKKISNDKSTYLKQLIQNMKLSQILDQELTLKEKGLERFWNKFSQVISKKLPLPIKTDLQYLDLTYLNGFVINTVLNSWSCLTPKIKNENKNLQKILCLLSQSLQQDTMEAEVIKTRKIRIYPTPKHRELFNKCIGTNRYIYNKALNFIKNNPEEKINFLNIRSKVLISDKDLKENELWQKEIPYDTRQLAIKELTEAYKINFTKLRNGTEKRFDMKFKSKKKCNAIFHIDKRALKSNFVIFQRRIKEPLRTKNKDKNYLTNKTWGDFQIIRTKINKWYLILPIKSKIINQSVPNKKNMIALDPGSRTFQTFYSKDKYGKIGDGITDILDEYHDKIDKLKSIIQKKELSSKTKYNLKKRCNILRTKIKNIVKDLHWKCANYLCKNYSIILLPTFGTQDMIKRKYAKRKIGKKQARDLLTLSHYTFKQRIKEKAIDFNSTVIDVNEAYTSKTCGDCGKIKNIGTNEVYNCAICKYVGDRDINASRNIYIRYLTYLNQKLVK